MREKIAKELAPHVTTLGGDPYGRFFLRKMELVLLNRRPDEWKEKVIKLKHHFAHQTAAPAKQAQATVTTANTTAPTSAETDASVKTKKKRKSTTEDGEAASGAPAEEQGAAEIEELFASVEEPKKKKKRAA